jgi:hypothetical protein
LDDDADAAVFGATATVSGTAASTPGTTTGAAGNGGAVGCGTRGLVCSMHLEQRHVDVRTSSRSARMNAPVQWLKMRFLQPPHVVAKGVPMCAVPSRPHAPQVDAVLSTPASVGGAVDGVTVVESCCHLSLCVCTWFARLAWLALQELLPGPEPIRASLD